MKQIENEQLGLYRPEFEHDSCGVGFITHIDGHRSHQIVSDALTILENMEHRGACGCDPETGDGAGILLQIPHEFLIEECISLDIHLGEPAHYGVGMIFFPKEITARESCRTVIVNSAEKMGLPLLGFRKLPVDASVVGQTALAVEPSVEQVFIGRPDNINNADDFERKLYVLRRLISKTITETVVQGSDFYIASMSCRVIVYKGQLTTYQLRTYYSDLADARLTSAFGMVHSRF